MIVYNNFLNAILYTRVFYKMLYDTSGKQIQHQHSVGIGSSKRSGGLIKQLSSAASGSQSPQQQNRLRMLLKRSSEPLLIFQHNQQQYQSRVCVNNLTLDILLIMINSKHV
jgi:hypothetical protein